MHRVRSAKFAGSVRGRRSTRYMHLVVTSATLLGTSALLVVTGALLLVTRSY